MDTAINPGTPVFAKTADGQELMRRAVSAVIEGEDFPVVWVTTVCKAETRSRVRLENVAVGSGRGK